MTSDERRLFTLFHLRPFNPIRYLRNSDHLFNIMNTYDIRAIEYADSNGGSSAL